MTPTLRFSEFRDAQPWGLKPFSQILMIGSGKDYKHLGSGPVPVYGSGGYMLSVSDYLYDGESACIGRKGTINNPIFLSGKFWTVDTLFYTHSFRGCLPRFVFLHFLQIDWLKHNEAGGVPSLSKSNIEKIEVAVPGLAEQQKIADCLTSLDEVIAGQGRKVEALKAHKRGLMQLLFPREGETRPRLRFPEFRNAPEWEKMQLVNVAAQGLTNGIFNNTKTDAGPYRLINVSEMYLPNPLVETDLAFAQAPKDEAEKKFVCYGDVFFTRSSLVREGIAYSNIYLGSDRKTTFDGHVIRLRPNVKIVNPLFLHYALKSDSVRSQLVSKSKTATMTTIGQSDVAETMLSVPHLAEQECIADCLSSLDTRIDAESNQLAALKTHKLGLMQQLFPAPGRAA